jgi:hypothetical protein
LKAVLIYICNAGLFKTGLGAILMPEFLREWNSGKHQRQQNEYCGKFGEVMGFFHGMTSSLYYLTSIMTQKSGERLREKSKKFRSGYGLFHR